MLIVDADHFKKVNDRYDHSIDDEVLKSLGRCLEVSMHRPDDLVARGGGEEFGMLLPDTDVDGALRIAKKIHEQVSTLDVHSSGIFACNITIGVGIASGTIKDEVNRGNMYRKADVVIHEAKKSRSQLYSPHPCLKSITRSNPTSKQLIYGLQTVDHIIQGMPSTSQVPCEKVIDECNKRPVLRGAWVAGEETQDAFLGRLLPCC